MDSTRLSQPETPKAHRLASLLARLTPFVNLSDSVAEIIHRLKLQFPDPRQNLHAHLSRLGVPQLVDYLVWFPAEKFTNIDIIGEGGFAKVYKGTVAAKNGEPAIFALKELKQGMEFELVLNTCLTTNGQSSPTVPLFGLSQHPITHTYLMVFAFAHHGTLETSPAYQNTDWLQIARKSMFLAQRLFELHLFGYSHHDLHPGNVMYVHQDTPVLIDVGVARSFDDGRSTGFYGRLEYFPPEFLIHGTQSPASDVYCFATLLWQLVTRVPPRDIASIAVARNPDRLRESMIPDAPAEFETVLRECWREDPAQRPYMWQVYHQLTCWHSSFKSAAVPFSARTMSFIEKLQQENQELASGQALSSHSENGASQPISRFYSHHQLQQLQN